MTLGLELYAASNVMSDFCNMCRLPSRVNREGLEIRHVGSWILELGTCQQLGILIRISRLQLPVDAESLIQSVGLQLLWCHSPTAGG